MPKGLTLYLDDSSDRESSTVVMGGYIAHEEMWPEFNLQWSSRLRQAGVRYFHATDFFNCRKEFAGWERNSKRHLEFRRRFTAIAERQVTLGIVYGVNLPAFKELVSKRQRLVSGTPHGRLTAKMWCARWCLEWLSSKGPQHGRPLDEPIAVIIESGTGSGDIVEYFRWLKRRKAPWIECFESFATGEKREILPLQAADLLAYEAMRDIVERHIPDSAREIRPSLQRLLARRLLIVDYQSREDLSVTVQRIEEMLLSNDPGIAKQAAVAWEGHGLRRKHRHLDL